MSRLCLAFLLAALALAPGPLAGSARAETQADADASGNADRSDHRLYVFDVSGDGTHLGEHRVQVRTQGARTEVEVSIELRWRLAYFTFFRYEHHNHLVWEQDRLVSMQARTNDNGTRHTVTVRPGPNGLKVSGSGGSYDAPADLLPTTYWRPETVRRTQMLDTQSGRLVSYTVEPAGRTQVPLANGSIAANAFQLSGDLAARLAYTEAGRWVGLRFLYDDTEIVYRPRGLEAAGR